MFKRPCLLFLCLILFLPSCKLPSNGGSVLPPDLWPVVTNILHPTDTGPVTPPVVTNTPPVVTNTPVAADPWKLTPVVKTQLRTFMNSYGKVGVAYKDRLPDLASVIALNDHRTLAAAEYGGVGNEIILQSTAPLNPAWGDVYLRAVRNTEQIGGTNCAITPGYEYWFLITPSNTPAPSTNSDGSINWPTNPLPITYPVPEVPIGR